MSCRRTVPLSFFYDWDHIQDDASTQIMREFKDNGEENLVVTEHMLHRIISEPSFLPGLKRKMMAAGVRFFEVHGLWGVGYDLVCCDQARVPKMIEEHKLAMDYAAEMGCKTYVVHIGAYESIFFRTPNEVLRPNGLRVLEQLLPHAQKTGLVIAVENSFEPSNTPDEVLYYINAFKDPHIACCLDAGHANIMSPGPGKTQEAYCQGMKFAWDNHIVQYADAFEKLAPHIVTMHLHDNDGFSDGHQLPLTGTIDWENLTSKIAKLPRLLSLQAEVSMGASAKWSIRRLCETFNGLFPKA